MSINITMPALSPTMEEGTLAKWHVKTGDVVSAGDVIAEIETDKATMEVEAVDEGTIGKILVDAGAEGVKVNAVIAVLLEEGEDAADVKVEDTAAAPSKPEPAAAETAAPKSAPAPVPAATPTTASAPKETSARIFASPLARRLAKEAGLDLASITGSGPKGRIVKADIETAKASGGTAAAAAPSSPKLSPNEERAAVEAMYEPGSYEVAPADGMRKTVASRLTDAKRDTPHFYLTADVKLDSLFAVRAEINASAPKDKEGKPEFKLSINDFIVKAWAVALQKVPDANATWAGDSILLHKRSDVAVAIAVPGGLFTPVVRSADTKTLREISAEIKDYAVRAKSKKLKPDEYIGGSSAVSNLGMFGVKHFTSIINPPHGTIVSIGAGEERVYVDNGEIKTANFMTISVSCDHRSVDGALGAQLMNAFKALVEQPVMMIV